MARVSPPNKLLSQSCSCYHMSRKLPGKLQKTSLSQPFFPAKKGRYAWKAERSFPKGILPTTHDHALLTKNFRALALVKINKSFLKSARSAHTTELATCNAHANLRRPARPPGFFMDFNFFWCFRKLKFSSFQKVSCLFTKYAPLALCMAVSKKPTKKKHIFIDLALFP